MKTVIGLYDSWDTADAVIEALLDYGFSHSDITVMSGDHWMRESGAQDVVAGLRSALDHGKHALLKLHASGSLAGIARDLMCNSGAMDMREVAEEETAQALTEPLAVALPHAAMK